MFNVLLILHSLLRYAVVIFLALTVLRALSGWLNRRNYGTSDKWFALTTLILFHLQLLIGFGLYFPSPVVKSFYSDPSAGMKVAGLRFFAVEHIGLMLLAAVVLTFGYSLVKKTAEGNAKFVKVFWFYLASGLLVMLAIPWPYREVARHWLPF